MPFSLFHRLIWNSKRFVLKPDLGFSGPDSSWEPGWSTTSQTCCLSKYWSPAVKRRSWDRMTVGLISSSDPLSGHASIDPETSKFFQANLHLFLSPPSPHPPPGASALTSVTKLLCSPASCANSQPLVHDTFSLGTFSERSDELGGYLKSSQWLRPVPFTQGMVRFRNLWLLRLLRRKAEGSSCGSGLQWYESGMRV